MKQNVHFSIDDVLNSFLWLERNDRESVFDAETFQLSKWLYETYGISTTYNCFFRTLKGSLKDVSERYRREIERAGFMLFSFHGWDETTDYKHINFEETLKNYKNTAEELVRIAGRTALTNVVRLHYFHGNADVVKALEEQGVDLLLTADDDRGSYDLGFDEETMARTGVFRRNGSKIGYTATDIRLENYSIDELRSYSPKEGKMTVVFTHESLTMQHETKDKLSALLKHIGESGI